MKLIIDFDSTFIKLEALDELAAIALKDKPNKEQIVNKIKEITNLGMEGKITFPESLGRRFELLCASRSCVEKLIEHLKENISDSILNNKKFFLENFENIYIISGGFKEYIYPVVKDFGIKEENILANEFVFDEEANIIGFNKEKYLAQENGKVKQIQALNLDGQIMVVGDGYTDYQIKEAGLANKFIAYCENVKRESVLEKADQIVNNFSEIVFE